MAASSAGLELLYASVKNQLRSQYDALVCCLHWFMVSAGFECVGTEEKETNQKSELLPNDWNEGTSDVYSLRYQATKGEDCYLLKVVRIDDALLVHILREKDDKVTDFSLETSDYVDVDHFGDFHRMFKNLNELQKHFKTELIDKMNNQTSAPTSRQQPRDAPRQEENPQGRDDGTDPLRVPRSRPPRDERPDWAPPRNPFVVGEGDLDPFSGAPPGMLVDPMRGGFPGIGPPGGGLGMPQRLPRGAVPPGARFDPIGPPDPDGMIPRPPRRDLYPGEPDPDDQIPPGFDDMFM